MTCHPNVHIEATATELDAAQAALIDALDAQADDETANENILRAMVRLRTAQARHAAARSGLDHLPDLAISPR